MSVPAKVLRPLSMDRAPDGMAHAEMLAKLERAALEVDHLKHRHDVDCKLVRVQQSKAFFMEEVAQAAHRRAQAQSGGGIADSKEQHGLALWEARLEVELCHRALALLRLQLSSAQEDVDDLQSASAVLRVEYESQVAAHAVTTFSLQETLAAHGASAAESARLAQLVKQLRATEAQLEERAALAEGRLEASMAAHAAAEHTAEDLTQQLKDHREAAHRLLATAKTEMADRVAAVRAAAAEQAAAAERRAAAADEAVKLADERLTAMQERAQLAEVRLQERGSLEEERQKLAKERARMCEDLSQDRAQAAEEKAQLTEAAMRDRVEAAEAKAARAAARDTAAQERVSRLEAELAAALESAAAEARNAQRQLAARDRRITALEQDAQVAQEAQGTPRRSVQHAVGAISAIVDALPPSSTKPPRRSRQSGAAASESPLAAIAEDEQAPAATAKPQQRRAATAAEGEAGDAVAEAQKESIAAAGAKAGKGRKGSAKAKTDRRSAHKRPAEAALADQQPAADEGIPPGAPAAAKPAKRSRKSAPEPLEEQEGNQAETEDREAALQQAKKTPVRRSRKSEPARTAVPAAEPENGLASEGRARRKRPQAKPYWMGSAAGVEEAAPAGGAVPSKQALPVAAGGGSSHAVAAKVSSAEVQPPGNADKRKQRRRSAAPAVQATAAPEADAMAVAAASPEAVDHPAAQATDRHTAVPSAAAGGTDSAPTEQPQGRIAAGEAAGDAPSSGAQPATAEAVSGAGVAKPFHAPRQGRPQGVAKIDLNLVWGATRRSPRGKAAGAATGAEKENTRPDAALGGRDTALAVLNPKVLAASQQRAAANPAALYQRSWAKACDRGAAAAPGKRKLLPPSGGAFAGAPPDHMLFGGVTVPKLKTMAR